MPRPSRKTLRRPATEAAPPPEPPRPVAVVDMGASAIRVVARPISPAEPVTASLMQL